MPEELPYIPETIRVHLGPPDSDAETIEVPFVDYIKNVASSELYPTWPDNALRANIYAQITFALNRIYNEWYRSKGYDFDITNSTQFDQAFTPGRDYFENIGQIVDQIFNHYVTKQGSVDPYFTQYCDGVKTKCEGLSQWGTVDLSNKGLFPYQILQHYYGNEISLVRDAPVMPSIQSYPGTPLRVGQVGNDVETIQIQLNRIGNNYPSIPKITPTDGIFTVDTEKAVKEFQRIFNLKQDGIVGPATWYKIKFVYTAVKQLAELSSEGVQPSEIERKYENELKEGSTGIQVRTIQYLLNIIGYFNQSIPYVTINGIYGPTTTDAVRAFQIAYNLPQTGTVTEQTYNEINRVYADTIRALPSNYQGERAKFYPGYILTKGEDGTDVEDLQTYLSYISNTYTSIPKLPITGYYGEQTANAVKLFQKQFDLEQLGVVDAATWDKIASVYNELKLRPLDYN